VSNIKVNNKLKEVIKLQGARQTASIWGLQTLLCVSVCVCVLSKSEDQKHDY